MDWAFITHHLISGSIPVMAALVLYFLIMRMIGKKQTAGHITASFVFCFYLIGVLTVTGICVKGASFSPRIVMIPFADMIRGPVDTVLIILLFVPFGFFLPLLYKEFDSVGRIALLGLLVSLSIEIIQMFGFGATDINDLITNTIGSCVGYSIFKLLIRVIPGSWIRNNRVNGPLCYLELLLFWVGSISIMLTIQPYLYHILFAAGIDHGEMHVW